MSAGKRRTSTPTRNLHAGRGAVGKTAVVGAKDRETGKVKAQVVEKTDAETLQRFVMDHVLFGTPLYTDENRAYSGLEYVYDHGTVKHSVGEYVNEQIHTNGTGIVLVDAQAWDHRHVSQDVEEAPAPVRHGDSPLAITSGISILLDQMAVMGRSMENRRIKYHDLIA